MAHIKIDGIAREIVSQEEWEQKRKQFLVKEKLHTRAGDKLASERRRLPWMQVKPDYKFGSTSGTKSLADLFDGRKQLIVYHHMLKSADPSPCPGCSMVGDQIPHLAHLQQRNTSLVFVSNAPTDEIEAFKKRMGWSVAWFTTADSFNADFDVTDGFGVNVFYRDQDHIYRSYYTTGRSVEMFGTIWAFLDLTPLGRQENWEDSPEGTPQTPPFQWWRLHDQYNK